MAHRKRYFSLLSAMSVNGIAYKIANKDNIDKASFVDLLAQSYNQFSQFSATYLYPYKTFDLDQMLLSMKQFSITFKRTKNYFPTLDFIGPSLNYIAWMSSFRWPNYSMTSLLFWMHMPVTIMYNLPKY